MKKIKTLLTCIILVFFFGACAPWVMVGGNYENSTENFKAEFPKGWRKYNLSKDNVLITKDGLGLQFIRISRTPIDNELEYTDKKFGKGMLPQEAGEVVIQNFRSNHNIVNQKVLANNPATIGGYPGFNIKFLFQTKDGMTKQCILYGFITEESYYELCYEASKRHYFSKDEADFERVKDTFKLLRDNV